jgi:tRNA uracil 4-sulfurtransferase
VQIVIHYAEIGLKGRNRPRFEAQLCANLDRLLRPLGGRSRKLWGRLLVELPDDAPWPAVRERLARCFGVAYYSRVTRCEPTIPAIEAAVDAHVASRRFASFGVRARRPEKNHPFKSGELAGLLGARVQAATGARVDLENPELWIEIHVMAQEALLLHERVAGPGGLPAGSAGPALSLISGGIDSPVASWELMKRGAELAFVHFHSAPFTGKASVAKAREVVRHLAGCQGATRLFLVPFGELQQTLVREAPSDPRIVLYRRFMLRVAEALAGRIGALALVTGESLGQVSSQTLANLDTIGRAATLPVLRPLIGRDKEEIVRRAREIGSFPISIEAADDCCSFLMPRNPATWTRPEPIAQIESRLDVAGLVEATLARVEEERIEPDP